MIQREIEVFLYSAGWERQDAKKGSGLAFYKKLEVKLPGGTSEERDFRVRFNKQSTTVELLMRRCNRWMRIGGAPFAITNTRTPLGEGACLFIGSYKIPAAR